MLVRVHINGLHLEPRFDSAQPLTEYREHTTADINVQVSLLEYVKRHIAEKKMMRLGPVICGLNIVSLFDNVMARKDSWTANWRDRRSKIDWRNPKRVISSLI